MPPTALAGATQSRQSLPPQCCGVASLRQSERPACPKHRHAQYHRKMVGMAALNASSKRGGIQACSISQSTHEPELCIIKETG